MNFRCYSQRLLNPFRGTMNIIEFEAAEAVTLDGVHWDIYVRDAELVKDLPNSHKVQTSDIRYGRWSENSGLKRGAIYPSDDFKLLEAQGAMVYHYLLSHHQAVPFPLIDVYELWLLAPTGSPLALLNSCIHEDDMSLDRLPEWCACFECGYSFQSPAMPADTHHEHGVLSAGDYLARYINHLAGDVVMAQWFKRNEDGSGKACEGMNLQPALIDRELDAAAFSTFLLNDSCHDARHQALIQDFFDWQAPCLLLLQNLSAAQRAQLEIRARGRALEVEKQYRLYPEIIDQSQITAARVEARLRQSSGRPPSAPDELMSPEYIELMHPSPTE